MSPGEDIIQEIRAERWYSQLKSGKGEMRLMNEPILKLEEQIINLYQDTETQVYEGWILKSSGRRLVVFPLYNVYPDSVDEHIRGCERIGEEKAVKCMFRIAENTNFYLHSRLEKNNYMRQECFVVGELHITEETTAQLKAKNLTETKKESNTDNGVGNIPETAPLPFPDCGLFLEKQKAGSIRENVFMMQMDENGNRGKCIHRKVGVKQGKLLFIAQGAGTSRLRAEDVLEFSLMNGVERVLVDVPETIFLGGNFGEYGFRKAYTYCCYRK